MLTVLTSARPEQPARSHRSQVDGTRMAAHRVPVSYFDLKNPRGGL
jgi:hypothetical protein